MHVKNCASALLGGAALVVVCACGEPPALIEVGDGAATPVEKRDGEEGALQTVTGRWYTQCRDGERVTDNVFDLRGATIQALVPDDVPGGYRVIQGIGETGSRFTIPDVPRGEYILRLSNSYYVTDQREIDARFALTPRCAPEPTPAEHETPVSFQLSNMTPYSAAWGWPRWYDTTEVMSPTARFGIHGSLDQHLSGGATEVDSTLSWPERFPLIDAAEGDELLVYHWRDMVDGNGDPRNQRLHSARVALDLFQTTSFTLQDGVPGQVSGTFQRLVPNKTLSFSLDRGLFDAGYSRMGGINAFYLEVETDRGHPITSANLRSMERSSSLVQTIANIPYADPFPASWGRHATVHYHHRRAVASPSGQHNPWLYNIIQSQLPFSGELPAGPVLSPAAEATVGGRSFEEGGLVPFDGQSPLELSWRAVPLASAYNIQVYAIRETGSTYITSLTTQGTSLRIPAALLAADQFYSFRLSAVRAGSDYGQGEIFLNEQTSYAVIHSARIRLSSTCGDGVVQAGEACDTAGESASCNADCTVSICGDGIANAATGEVCDSARMAALECDYDCSRPVCGDGIWNESVEDCDDGNSADTGNGCSAQCKVNNVCGNGRVESLREHCDAFGLDTAVCDSDCTFSFCGDGHLNTAAGEQCDDGYRNGTRCSATCQIIAP